MYMTTTPLSPTNSGVDNNTLAYPNAQQISTANIYGFWGLLASPETLFSIDAYSTGNNESLLASPRNTDNAQTTQDYYQNTYPSVYSQSNYIALKDVEPIESSSRAPSLLYPVMAPLADSAHTERESVSSNFYYPVLSYDANMSISSLPTEGASANHAFESTINMTSPVFPADKNQRRSADPIMTTRDLVFTPINELVSSMFFECPVCDKSFAKRHSLKLHMRSHSTEKPFKCSHCDKTFARCHDMKRHQQLHQGVKVFRCEGHLRDGITKWGCGKKFARSDALTRHLRAGAGRRCLKPLVDETRAREEKKSHESSTPLNTSLSDGSELCNTYLQPVRMTEMPYEPSAEHTQK